MSDEDVVPQVVSNTGPFVHVESLHQELVSVGATLVGLEPRECIADGLSVVCKDWRRSSRQWLFVYLLFFFLVCGNYVFIFLEILFIVRNLEFHKDFSSLWSSFLAGLDNSAGTLDQLGLWKILRRNLRGREILDFGREIWSGLRSRLFVKVWSRRRRKGQVMAKTFRRVLGARLVLILMFLFDWGTKKSTPVEILVWLVFDRGGLALGFETYPLRSLMIGLWRTRSPSFLV